MAKRASTTTSKAKKNTKGKKAKTPAKGRGSTGDKEVTIDRRRTNRRQDDGSKTSSARSTSPALERRKKVNRRRQIDPTTCERDYTESEVEFMNALDDYKRANGRMFPTCSEVLEVVRSLGYVKLSPSELQARQSAQRPSSPDDAELKFEEFEENDDESELAALGTLGGADFDTDKA